MNTGISSNTLVCPQPMTQRERHIPNQITMLNNNLDRLDKAVGAIAERLSRVIRQEACDIRGESDKNLVEKTEWIVPVAADLRDANRNLSGVIVAIEDLTDRLEV